MKHILFILFLLLFAENPVSANKNKLQFFNISTEDGLSHFSVSCIEQDNKGFMWFGTLDGLNKYDGYGFTTFKPSPQDSMSISNNVIRSLYKDSRGIIWIGTEGGLNRYHPEQQNFTSYRHVKDNPNSLVHDIVHCIYEDKDSLLWLGTKGGGVSCFDNKSKSFTNFRALQDNDSSLLDNNVHCFHQEKNMTEKIIWTGTDKGLNRLNMTTGEINTITSFEIDPTTNKEFAIMHIYQDRNNRFWLGTWNNGLICYDLEKGFIKKFNKDNEFMHETNIILDIKEASPGILWIGTRGGGLYKFNIKTGDFINYRDDQHDNHSISNNDVMSVFESNAGILWVGTKMAGINKANLRGKQFNNLKYNPYKKNTLNDKIVQAVCEDDNGMLWFGTRNGGINKYNPKNGTFEYYTRTRDKNSLINNNVLDIIKDKDKHGRPFLWIATDGGFVDKFYIDNKQFIHYDNKLEKPAAGSMYVYSLLKDSDDIIWAGSWGTWLGGLHKLDKERDIFINYIHEENNKNTPSSNVVHALFEDSQGIIWIGTKGGGLNKLTRPGNKNIEPGDFTYYKHDFEDSTSISHNDVFSIFEAHNNVLWIGTGGGGLNKFNRKKETFTHFTKEDGLPSDVIYGIEEDNNNFLWLSTSNGLSRFDPLTGNFKNYDKRDGLISNGFSLGAQCKTDNGKFYFGSIEGVTSFYPDSIKNNMHIPPVVITKFLLDQKNGYENYSKPVTETNKIILPYSLNDFSLEFSALDYTLPEKNKYAYKLEGYQSTWKYTGADRRYAHYTNIPPGEYIFRVIGSNNDAVWNDAGASISIVIEPPFYMTTWFKIAVLLAIIIIILVWIRFILKKHREQYEAQTQETLFAKENQLRTLIDNIPDFIYIKDKNSRFIVANKKLVAVTGARNTKDMEGKTDHDFYDKNLADQFLNDEQEIMRSGKPLIGKTEPGKDEDGNERVISSTKIPLKNNDGEVIGLVGIGRDITEIKEAEEKIIAQAESLQETNVELEEKHEEIQQQKEEIETQRDELQRLNASKDKFFSIIGHDLKNPFNAIISLSEHLSNNFGEMSDDEKLELIRLIYISSENAYELLENLLQWSRSQTGRIDYKPDVIDIYNILTNNIDFLKVNAEKKHISIHHDLKEKLLVYADKNMINTIFRNLLNNAIKFTKEKGNIRVGYKIEDNYIAISITDDGIGMDTETRDKLFSISEQQSVSGTMGESGTGLGLIICDEFIKKNRGKIFVESEPGKGSTFIVKLPKEGS